MRTASILALAASAKLAFAHSTIYAAWINGVDQGLGNSAAGYIRSPPNNDPVKDVTSKDLTCNVNGATAAAKTLSVEAGDKFTFEWHHNNRDSGDDIIASSHLGPVLVYIAPTETGSSGEGWVKIYEDGYNPTTKKWAVDTLIANKGQHSITIPDITAGKYLLRAEIIALHEGDRIGGAQLYMECVQVEITSAGTTALPAGVAIPGAYTATDAGINFNLYGSFTSYPIPGPAVWDGAASSGSASSKAVTTAAASSTAAATTSVSTKVAAATTSAVVVATSAPATTAVPATSTKVASSAVVVSSAVSSKVVVSSAAPTTLATVVKTTTAAASTVPTATTGGTVPIYGRCGGKGHTGSTTCATGSTCKEQNPYYSQCVSSS